MSRSSKMAQLLRLARLAAQADKTGQSAQETIEQESLRDASRRRFTQGAVAGVATAAAGAMTPAAWAGASKLRRMIVGSNVAVVGAGLAGLSCASELTRKGVTTQVFEAAGRVGGRCSTLRGFFPGQVAERGGEFIANSHHTMIGYARALNLPLEDVSMLPGNPFYHFDGRTYSEAQVVEEYRAFSASMQQDLSALSYPTADRYSEADELFDLMSLDDYLGLQGAGGLLRKVIGAAYAAEYGAGIDELSSISFLRFVHGDKRGKFAQVGNGDGIVGGEGFHVVDGNDRITTGLAARLPTPVQLGHKLIAVRKLANGRVRLTFDVAGRSVQSDHDAVVLTLPFSVLRDVQLDASLELPAWKRYAINHAAMGDSSKLMVGFDRPYWYIQHGSSGTGFGDRSHLQSTWETNAYNGNENRAVLTTQLGGAAAKSLVPRGIQAEAMIFLDQLESALPGAHQAAQRTASGDVVAFAHNWSKHPYSKGAYSNARPGYFTMIAHNEAKRIGNVMFAGEHTSSFYEWQGTMEGAALSGLRAAAEVCTQFRVR
jgi:monoamine oxidase